MINIDFRQDILYAGLWDSKSIYASATSNDRISSCYELELVLEHGGNAYINGEKFPVVKNNFHCIKPGTVRHTEFPLKCLYIKFNTESKQLRDYLSQISDCFSISDTGRVYELVYEIISLFNSPQSEMMICSRFTELLYTLQKESSLSGNKSLFVIEKAKAYIDANLNTKITLPNIAEYVHFNPVYFHRIFKRETGVTPAEYIISQRIYNAKKELRTTDKSITQIAFDNGFDSVAYFGSVFKKRTGCTPLAYRKTQGDKYLIGASISND